MDVKSNQSPPYRAGRRDAESEASGTSTPGYGRALDVGIVLTIGVFVALSIPTLASEARLLGIHDIDWAIAPLDNIRRELLWLAAGIAGLRFFVRGDDPHDRLRELAKRLLEIAFVVVGLEAVAKVAAWATAPETPYEASIAVELIQLATLFLLRVLVGRHINGLLVLASTAIAIGACLFAADRLLAQSERSRMVAHYEYLYGKPIDDTAIDLDQPNSDRWTWGHRVENNRFGFRGREFEVPKPKNTLRIMVIGDSLTWGAGLAPNERYSNMLEDRLRVLYPESHWEVLNFGVSGGSTIQQSAVLEKYLDIVQPDLVVVGFCVNDPQPAAENYSIERTRYYPLHNLIAMLRHAGMDHVRSLLHGQVDRLLAATGLIPSWQEGLDRTYRKDSTAWLRFTAALQRIAELTNNAGAGSPIFALLSQNISNDSPKDPYIDRWLDQAGTVASNLGFDVVDPRPAVIATVSADELRVNPFDAHPSRPVNAAYAETILRSLSHIYDSRFAVGNPEPPASDTTRDSDSSRHDVRTQDGRRTRSNERIPTRFAQSR
ncbi:MAG: hypothetical protein KDJ24_12900 [Gammaproteobacteria bacterium]|nr:hypothetical protein [Gammaproteobacteria bacterium]